MADLLNFFIAQDIQPDMVVKLMILSVPIAIFHSLFIFGLLEFDFKPGWIFFVLNPAIIGVTALININYALLVFILLFISVFILGFISIISVSIIRYKKESKDTEKFNKKYNIAPTPWLEKALGTIFFIAFVIVFFSSGAYAFVIIFAYIAIKKILPNSTNQFLKLQATLPTSRIRSVAMGLAEVQGTLKMIEPLLSPIKNKECIGFVYHIDKVSKNNDGDKRYSNIFTETKVKPFIIKDETGEMKVIPDKLEFVWIEKEDRYERSGKRYTQYLLKEGDEVLMMGKVSLNKNTPVLIYESIRNIFAISPVARVLHYNIYKPLLNSFVIFTALFAFISALILISPVSIKNDQIVIEKPVFKNYWKDIHQLSDLSKIFDHQQEPVSNHGSSDIIEKTIEVDAYSSDNNVHDQLENKNLMNEGIIKGSK